MKWFQILFLISTIFSSELFAGGYLAIYIGKDKLNRPVVKDPMGCYIISGDEVMTPCKCSIVVKPKLKK